jgi:hypothetical protein
MESADNPSWDSIPTISGALAGLAYAPVWDTRMTCAENPDGSKGGAARAVPDPNDPDLPHSKHAVDLGIGWKVRPFIALSAGETATLADIEGPGSINHIWITCSAEQWRGLVLRMYWDNEDNPSVECPLGDFFAMGHDGASHEVNSMPIVVAPSRACNSYWPMPFRERARVTLSNDTTEDVDLVAFKILYRQHPVPAEARYFHAQWRRSLTERDHPEHTILDGVEGCGYYAGTYLAWTALSTGWWGEGEVKFFLDGDDEFPTICDTGTEDYFGGAWCFYSQPETWARASTLSASTPFGLVPEERTFSTPFLGLPLADIRSGSSARRFSLYRWHVLDPIGFHKDLRVTVQALGWWPNGTYQPLTDDIASLAVWYQNEPHNAFPALPELRERWAR